MLKTVEKIAKTEEEAIRAALNELGVQLEQAKVEVLEKAKSGFLGIGSAPARVRVSCEVEEPADQKVAEFLKGLFERMEVEAEAKVEVKDDGAIAVELEGEGIGALIGRRGETLDAIQHLCNYAVNRGDGQRIRVSIDAENYRAKREESLVKLAKKVAEKVLRYRKSLTLEPMNAYERHIIHTALQDVAGVTTFSTGSEPNRRVVVSYDAANAPQRSERPAREGKESRERGGYRRGGRDRDRSRRGYSPRPAPVEEPIEADEEEGDEVLDPSQLIADLGQDKSNTREWC